MSEKKIGAVMKDGDGNEVFVSTEHVYKAVVERQKLGWKIVSDHRPKGHPSHPEYGKEQ